MRTRDDIEAFLSRSGHPHRELAEDTWLVTDPSDAGENIVVRITEGLVVFRLKVLELGKVRSATREQFFAELLRLNGEDMVHGAYGISEDNVIMIATLRMENLDFNEFSGTLDDFSVALSDHYPKLRDLIADGA